MSPNMCPKPRTCQTFTAPKYSVLLLIMSTVHVRVPSTTFLMQSLNFTLFGNVNSCQIITVWHKRTKNVMNLIKTTL